MILNRADQAQKHIDAALEFAEERLWMHEREKAERIKRWSRRA